MTTYSDSIHNATISRRFRAVSILAVVYMVFNITAWITTSVLVNLIKIETISNEFLFGYDYLTYFLQYGIKITMFAFLLAATKHLQPKNVLLKLGSIVGVAGAALMFVVSILSAVYTFVSFSHVNDPSLSETGWMKILLIVCGNPINRTAFPWIAPIGLIVCAASFITHGEKAVKAEAITLVAVLATERIVELIPMSSMITNSLSAVFNFIAIVLMVVLFTSLAKYHKQA